MNHRQSSQRLGNRRQLVKTLVHEYGGLYMGIQVSMQAKARVRGGLTVNRLRELGFGGSLANRGQSS